MTCKAKVINDQYICDRCGLQWDVKDPDRPDCLSNAHAADLVFERHVETGRKAIDEMMEKLKGD